MQTAVELEFQKQVCGPKSAYSIWNTTWDHPIITFELRGKGASWKKQTKTNRVRKGAVRSERSHFKRFQQCIIAAIT